MYSARRGEGVKRNSEALKPQPSKTLEDMVGSVGKMRREKIDAQYGPAGTNRPADFVRYRCIGMEYVDMVLGTPDFAEYVNLKTLGSYGGPSLAKRSRGARCLCDIKTRVCTRPDPALPADCHQN